LDFFVMVAALDAKIKPTARRALAKTDALYLPGPAASADEFTRRALDELAARQGMKGAPPLFTRDNFADLVEFIRASLAGEGAGAGRASRLAAAQTL
jgi:hypothetical protein